MEEAISLQKLYVCIYMYVCIYYGRQNNGYPKMSMPQSLEPIDMLHGKKELRLQRELRFLIGRISRLLGSDLQTGKLPWIIQGVQ